MKPLHIFLLASAFVAGCTTSANEMHGPAWVIDGDTVAINGVHVRLKGVDAPELSQPGGLESKRAMQAIVGAWLTCQLTGERTYNRMVGWCRNAAGEDIGAAIVSAGKALACAHYSRRYVALGQPETLARQARAVYCGNKA
jgi:micrococcal nuclease